MSLYTVQPSGSTATASGGTGNAGSAGNMGGLGNIAGSAVSLLGSLGSAYSLYKSIGDADEHIGRLGAYKLNPGTGYGLSEAKSALLNYSPVPYATTADFGWNPRQAELSLLGSTASGALSSSNAGLAGLTTALNFITGVTGNVLSHRKAINEVNKYNKEVGRLNNYNYSVLDSNLKNTKADMLYNSIYNSMASGGPITIGSKLMTPFGKRFSKGGTLSSPLHSYGADWTNGLTFINNGSSHESNPYDGVQMGVDNKGTPNLVEEGEVIWNDYVFSNRIRVPKAIREKYKLRGQKDLTFADAVKKAQKESEERPNDPISQRGLDDMLVKLAMAQENERRKMGPDNVYAQGGSITIKPSKRGTFTAAATKHGMGVQEFASKVLANKEDYSPAMVKKANFARNAAKWHAYGGNLYALGSEMVNWVNGLSDADYQALLTNIGGKALNYKTDRAGLITYANTGKPGAVFNGITNAYNTAHTAATTKPDPADGGTTDADLKDNDNFDLDNVVVTAQANKWKNPYLKDGIWDPGYYNWVSKLVTDPDGIGEDQVLYNPEGKYGVLEGDPDLPDDIVAMLQNTTTANNRWSHVAVNQYQDYLKSLEDNDDGEVIMRGSSPLELLRFAPIVGSAIGLFANRNPDYGHSNAILSAIQGIRDIHPRTLGDYRKYTPFDTLFYANPLGAEARDTKRSLAASAAGNRGQAMSGILAADYNYINSLGQLARQAEEYNRNQSKEVSEFNRDTHEFNIEQDIRAQLANAENFKLKLNALSQGYGLRDAQDARLSAGLSTNLSGFFNNLGNLGIDAANRLDRDWLIRTGALKGDLTFANNRRKQASYGGKIKRRRGLTI